MKPKRIDAVPFMLRNQTLKAASSVNEFATRSCNNQLLQTQSLCIEIHIVQEIFCAGRGYYE